MKLVMQVGFGSTHIALDGDPALPPKRAQPPPQFSGHVRCGETAEWIKMPLGMEVGLGLLDDFILDGDPAPTKKRAPNFRSMSTVAKRLDSSGCHLVRR